MGTCPQTISNLSRLAFIVKNSKLELFWCSKINLIEVAASRLQQVLQQVLVVFSWKASSFLSLGLGLGLEVQRENYLKVVCLNQFRNRQKLFGRKLPMPFRSSTVSPLYHLALLPLSGPPVFG